MLPANTVSGYSTSAATAARSSRAIAWRSSATNSSALPLSIAGGCTAAATAIVNASARIRIASASLQQPDRGLLQRAAQLRDLAEAAQAARAQVRQQRERRADRRLRV